MSSASPSESPPSPQAQSAAAPPSPPSDTSPPTATEPAAPVATERKRGTPASFTEAGVLGPNARRNNQIVNRDGTANIRRIGLRTRFLTDIYHRLIAMTWPRFLLVVLALYVVINGLFAVVYDLDPGGIENARPGSFADCFYFSVQTMATIGYGKMVPATAFTHLVVTLESLFGLMSTALMTGLVFAKFSRPTARILFSRVAVISMRDGIPSLVFRVCNERGNQVAEAQLSVVLFRSERTVEGEGVRRFYDLPLWRQRSPMFAISWTAVHQIVPGSHLYGETMDSLRARDTEILVTITGTDVTLSQTVHARHAYRMADIRWNERFVDIFGLDEDGHRFIDYRLFHDTVPVDPAHAIPSPPPGAAAAAPAASAEPART